MNYTNQNMGTSNQEMMRGRPVQVLVWNVQGAGSSEFMNVLKEHIRVHRPTILALLETHIAGARAQTVAIKRKPEEVDVTIVQHHDQYITMQVQQGHYATWFLTVIYASPRITQRDTLWGNLHHFASKCTYPWLLAGDFNETTSLDERNHGGPDMLRRCTRFKHWIANTGLIDLGYSGPKFTWSRGRDWDTLKQARLDRALCNMAWRLKFPEGAVRHLLQAQSDHAPILLSLRGFSYLAKTRKPFRFQVAWTTHTDFNIKSREEMIRDGDRNTTYYHTSTVIRTRFNRIEALQRNVLARVDRKLAGWKAKCLFLVGRVTLIQATITAIPVYTMQTARIPRSVCDELDRRIRRFLWRGATLERKPHLVAWEIMTKEKDNGGLGLRSMRQLNSAYLMKLGWRLATEPNSLWVKILRTKHCKSRDAEKLERQGPMSNTWKGILESLHLTKQGVGHAIGDGRRTKFWTHKWIDGKALLPQATCDVPVDQHNLLVRDYWQEGDKPTGPLSPELAQRITSFELAPVGVEDSLYWAASKSGEFSIKSALAIIRGEQHTLQGLDWKWVWKAKVPQRIRLFAWLVVHDKLLTNAERYKRHMVSYSNCVVCGAEREDINHILRRCPQAFSVWQALNFKDFTPVDRQLGVQEWFKLNATKVHEDPHWQTKFLTTTWYIWKWRCKASFGTVEEEPEDRGSFLVARFYDIIQALESLTPPLTDSRSEPSSKELVRWEAPPEGWVILNTDGAAKGNPRPAGAGGVLRDEKGGWRGGFSENLGSCSAMKAEICVVLCGLRLAQRLKIRKLWVQLDSMMVVGMFQENISWCPEHVGLLHQCKALLKDNTWDIHISHCYREANQVADTLANMGIELDSGVTYYYLPPMEVKGVLLTDVGGVYWPRHGRF
ncbi:hypothetical protein Cgig2_013540 [Carnegiea gigantea]|uniref:RNase H type-1 domain-containing protein n=1 Tax=Carnegiea gigantea TaxID=171969 RepID=A0A9Q1Q7G6_9CARY|nr:hypothetical protein Cgig2_013540 [Carnegiea gigantea]